MQVDKGGTGLLHLPPQHFAEVLHALRARAASGGHERRQVTRIDVEAPVQVAPMDGGLPGEQKSVLIRDLSVFGLGLLYPGELPAGIELAVCLPREGKAQPLWMRCVVTHCRRLADGIFSIGLLFRAVIDQDTLDKAAQVHHVRRSILG